MAFSIASAMIRPLQFSDPRKATNKITLLYILIFIFLDMNLEDKDRLPNDSKHSLTSICS